MASTEDREPEASAQAETPKLDSSFKMNWIQVQEILNLNLNVPKNSEAIQVEASAVSKDHADNTVSQENRHFSEDDESPGNCRIDGWCELHIAFGN